MVKAFFKHAERKWYTFLICIPVGLAGLGISLMTCYHVALLGASEFMSYFIAFVLFSIILTLPLLMITIPASRDLGSERRKLSIIYVFIYQIEFSSAIFILILPLIIYSFPPLLIFSY